MHASLCTQSRSSLKYAKPLYQHVHVYILCMRVRMHTYARVYDNVIISMEHAHIFVNMCIPMHVNVGLSCWTLYVIQTSAHTRCYHMKILARANCKTSTCPATQLVSTYVCPSVFPSVCPSICPSVCPSICPSVCPSFCLSLSLHENYCTHPPTHTPTHTHTYMYIYERICTYVHTWSFKNVHEDSFHISEDTPRRGANSQGSPWRSLCLRLKCTSPCERARTSNSDWGQVDLRIMKLDSRRSFVCKSRSKLVKRWLAAARARKKDTFSFAYMVAFVPVRCRSRGPLSRSANARKNRRRHDRKASWDT
jgi:hypothetical protein